LISGIPFIRGVEGIEERRRTQIGAEGLRG